VVQLGRPGLIVKIGRHLTSGCDDERSHLFQRVDLQSQDGGHGCHVKSGPIVVCYMCKLIFCV
jgi:hypothetical protein